MRKWVVIGVLFVVVAGILGFVFKFNGNSVEYHREKYVAAVNGRMWMERVRDVWSRITGRPVDPRAREKRVVRELQFHEQALIKLGYFEERRFLVFSRAAVDLVMRDAVNLWIQRRSKARLQPCLPHAIFVEAQDGSGGISKIQLSISSRREVEQSLIVVARPQDMATWAELIQRADVAVQNVPTWNEVIRRVGLLDHTPK